MNTQRNEGDDTHERRLPDAILVHQDGVSVVHSFLPAADAHKRLDETVANGGGGSVFVLEDCMGAKLYYDVSPDLRSRVEQAKQKLKRDLHWRDVMNRHGIPADRTLRGAVANAMREILGEEVLLRLA